MISSQRKALFLPAKIIASIMIISLLVFYFGPIPWIDKIDFAVVEASMLFFFYVGAFVLGYYCKVPRKGSRKFLIKNDNIMNYKMYNLLKYTIVINLILTVANAFIYAGVSNVSQLFTKMIQGLTSPDLVYYEKDATSRSGNIIVWITCFYSPIMYVTQVYALYILKKLNPFLKVCYIVTLVVEVMRWLSVGTNRGLFDIVVLLLFVFMVKRMDFYGKSAKKNIADKRKQKKMLIIVVSAVIIFFAFFSYALSSRVNGEFHEEYFNVALYKELPAGIKFFLEKFDSYLAQGYSNTIKIIRNCKFQWTYGAGNSRFLMGILNRFLGISLEERTYPYQLAQFGVDPLAAWHTAYSWFASDLTYWGIIPFMFIVGYFMSSLAREVLLQSDPISLTLLYFVFLSLVNASCTNYVLAFTNGFVGFWILFVVRFIKKHHVTFGKV